MKRKKAFFLSFILFASSPFLFFDGTLGERECVCGLSGWGVHQVELGLLFFYII